VRGLLRAALAAFVLVGSLIGAAAAQEESQDTARAMRGTPGVATERAVARFEDAVVRQALAPPAPSTPPVKKGVFKLLPPLPVPKDVVIGPVHLVPIPLTPAAGEAPLSPAPASSFQGIGDNNTTIPPDTHGAVGPNHLVVAVNPNVRVQNRTGGVISTVSLNNFWTSVNGGSGAFDPKVYYDPFAQRWIMVASDDSASASSGILVGVSQTSDPTGSWNLYKVDADPGNLVWADYPSLGFNKDWIVVQVNMFPNAGGSLVRTQIYAFSKANLYAGGAGTFTLFSRTGIGGTQVPAVTYDNALATVHLVQSWNGNFGGAGFLRMYSITGTVGAEVFNDPGLFVSTANTWNTLPNTGGGDFAPQLGSTRRIQNNDARMQHVVYRNGTLWATQTVFLPAGVATRSAVQWWEITTAGAVGQLGRVDDPSGVLFSAFPSIAVNANNDVLLGYSRFSAAQFASANYSFRASTDPPGTMQADFQLKAGEAKYDKDFGSGENRWGDFSAATVDPLNDLHLWTIQQYAAAPSGGFDRWGVWWGRLAIGNTPPSITPAAPLSRQQGSPASASTIATVSDAETPAGSLVVTTTSVPTGLSVSGIANSAGTVSASVAAACDAAVGANTVGLRVTDGGGLSADANLTVNVLPNTPPTLGVYPTTANVATGGSTTVSPAGAPSDNGTVAVVATSGTFTGGLSVDSSTGVVTVTNAEPPGSHVVTVTATDNCGATAQRTFTLDVTSCGDDTPLVADGRSITATLAAGGTKWYTIPVSANRAYSVEVANVTSPAPALAAAFFAGVDECGPTSTLVTRNTATMDPASTAGPRVSFASGFAAGTYRVRLTNPGGAPVVYTITLAELTLFSPAWTTNGSYNTYYSFQNTTNATVTGTLRLLSTAGSTLASVPLSVPPGETASVNTASAGAPRNQTGVATFIHDGPPSAIQATAAVANFTLATPYIQPVKFNAVRELR